MINTESSSSLLEHSHQHQHPQQQEQQPQSSLFYPPVSLPRPPPPTPSGNSCNTVISTPTSNHNPTIHNQNPQPLLPLKVTCLVKANDTSQENVLHSDKLGLRFRHILSDASQTVASFSKSIMEEYEFVKYVHAICQDFTNQSNCDITLCYGDEKKSKIMMRYLDEPYRSSAVVKDQLVMFVRLVEKGDGASVTTAVLRAKGEKK
jgi:hypothetical protein